MCGGIHYGEVEGLVSVERWSCSRGVSCVVECTLGDWKVSVQNIFPDIPLQISSLRELEKELMQMHSVLEDDSKPWDMRVQTLKRLRGVLKGGALDHKEFHTQVKGLEAAMMTSVKDLRSQVCREACITLRWVAASLGSSGGGACAGGRVSVVERWH